MIKRKLNKESETELASLLSYCTDFRSHKSCVAIVIFILSILSMFIRP